MSQELITDEIASDEHFRKEGHGFLAFYFTEVGIKEGMLTYEMGETPVFERHFKKHKMEQAKLGYKARIVFDDSINPDTREYMEPSNLRVLFFKTEKDYEEAMEELWGYLTNIVNNSSAKIYRKNEVPPYLEFGGRK